ncbi:MAG: cell wall hydrolase [Lachnospiraceae bacterium]|nr:cell wall hydrolase [Lachnospiraceae bacterium]
MNLRNNLRGCVVTGSIVVIVLSAAAITANVTSDYRINEATNEVNTEVETEISTDMVAGVCGRLEEVGQDAIDVVSVERADTVAVSAAEAEPEPEPTEEEKQWSNKLMADVGEFLYIRSQTDENAPIEGKLYRGSAADIVEILDGWYHITSGTVDGYVKSEYCVTDAAAYALAQEVCDSVAVVQIDGLRIRSQADTDAAVIKTVTKDTVLVVDTDAPETTEWVAVKINGKTGYVAENYVEQSLNIGAAVSVEEEQAAIQKQKEAEAAKAAEEAKAAQAAQQTSAAVTQKESVAASTDDVTLLGAIIQCEAGGESYEGQLAVGAVVVNRVRSGAYPSSVYGVIYQSGQFAPAGSGKVDAAIAAGVSSSCLQAAQEALSGTDNTGGALSFQRASGGHAGVVIGNHVFY